MDESQLQPSRPGDLPPPPPPDAPGPEAAPMDRVSLTAFVLSLVGIGIVAIPLAIWGLVRGGPRRRGRGFAVAALALSVAWAVLGSIALVTSGLLGGVGTPTAVDQAPLVPAITPSAAEASGSATPTASPGAKPAQPTGPLAKQRKVFWAELEPTMCILDSGNDAVDVRVVDCRSEHEAEVMAVVDLGGENTWPGDAAVDEVADQVCREAFAAYVGLGYDESRLEYDYFTADKAGWEAGNHIEVCILGDPEQPLLTRAMQGVVE